ncbi:uncharacterized protein LOC143917737 [Arctopsyche grandis]|uniref:uncharacterized protein LOC143917737 n=1 Tax=Arctopsyche grandis TaxID=121162 RepID=UPI00406D92B6
MAKLSIKEQCSESDHSTVSLYPSYTNIEIRYDTECLHRYWRSIAGYNRQFMKELLLIERMQNKALEGVKVHREFTQSVLHRVIPKRGNMKHLCKIELTPKDQRRLQLLLKRF